METPIVVILNIKKQTKIHSSNLLKIYLYISFRNWKGMGREMGLMDYVCVSELFRPVGCFAGYATGGDKRWKGRRGERRDK